MRTVARSRQVYMNWWWKHCLLHLFYLGSELILMDNRKSFRSSACLMRIAGPCPAEPFQLVPARLGLSPAGPYQLWWTNLRISTETRPVRNKTPKALTSTSCILASWRKRSVTAFELRGTSGGRHNFLTGSMLYFFIILLESPTSS